MSPNRSPKVLIRRPFRRTDGDRGRSLPDETADSAELELVSTQMLKVMLSSRDASDREAIASAASTSSEGVLARNRNNGRYEIIEDEELQAIVAANRDLPRFTRPADVTLEPLHDYVDDEELALVSTHALRKVLDFVEDLAAEAPHRAGSAYRDRD